MASGSMPPALAAAAAAASPPPGRDAIGRALAREGSATLEARSSQSAAVVALEPIPRLLGTLCWDVVGPALCSPQAIEARLAAATVAAVWRS